MQCAADGADGQLASCSVNLSGPFFAAYLHAHFCTSYFLVAFATFLCHRGSFAFPLVVTILKENVSLEFRIC